jgi:hypothetical protein
VQQWKPDLLDFVGAIEQRRRHFQAEGAGRFQVDDQSCFVASKLLEGMVPTNYPATTELRGVTMVKKYKCADS